MLDVDTILVFLILLATVVLFLSERLAPELTSLLSLLSLYLTGVLTLSETLEGFSNPLVLTLGSLFIVSASLFKTGVAGRMGDWLQRWGGEEEQRVRGLSIVVSSLLSAFMSSTGTAAVLIPVVLEVGRKARIGAGRLLLPLAYGCLVGGSLTLVGTAPNLVVQEALIAESLPLFTFLSFTPVGACVLVVTLFYFHTLGDRLLPRNAPTAPAEGELTSLQLADDYQVPPRLFWLGMKVDSKLIGCHLGEVDMRTSHGLNFLAFREFDHPDRLIPCSSTTELTPGRCYLVHGSVGSLESRLTEMGLEIRGGPVRLDELSGSGGLAEVILTPRSRLLGETLRSSQFLKRYGVNVVALKRLGRIESRESELSLRCGDSLLVGGNQEALARLWSERGSFLVTSMPKESRGFGFRTGKAWLALAITFSMLVALTLQVAPSVVVVLLSAGALLLTGCLTSEDAYRNMNWQSLILVACLLPMASALKKTGGVDYLASSMTSTFGTYGPHFVLLGLIVLTTLLSQFISNTATTVLLAPVALQSANQMGVEPHAFLMGVALAASAAFLTPLASPVNTLVFGPGEYRFSDFLKVGLPLQLMVVAVAAILLPLQFPFH